ncbi:hypothetical protein JXA47_10375 [Candidatus Sumerlaeota bacterium]|nr:hypothetical protein [Candidatus Sumerlaeota bacterium]
MMRNHLPGIGPVLALATLALLAPPASARMIAGGPPDLDRLVQASDVICEAEVLETQTEFVDRRILTTYTLRADRYLMGSGADTFSMTVLGGAVEEPFPVAMVFDDMVTLSAGQDVLLFLETPDASPGLSSAVGRQAVSASPRPVLDARGVYTILTDSQTGQRHVSQIRYSDRGIFVTPEVNAQILNRMEANAASEPPALGHENKIELVERGETLVESFLGSREHGITNSTGEVLTLEPPRSRQPLPTTQGAETTPSAQFSSLRTLEDFRSEVLDLIEERGE